MSTSSDLIFQVAKANVESAQVAFEAGHKAGYIQGYREAMADAKRIVGEFKMPEEPK